MRAGGKQAFISYPYATACIRSMEGTMLSVQEYKELAAIKEVSECIGRLRTLGFFEGIHASLEELLSYEQERTLKLLSRCVSDLSPFSIFFLPNQFHNLKAAVKSLNTSIHPTPIYYEGELDEKELIEASVVNKAFDHLPDYMQKTAMEAYKVYLHSGDGMLSDTLIDRGLLEAVKKMGNASEENVIRQYADTFLSLANMKLAFRLVRIETTSSFLEQALVEGGELSKSRLKAAILNGEQELISYLNNTSYREGVAAYQQSPAIFECWCDKELYRKVAAGRNNSFSLGPLAAFYVARENEMKSLRFLLTGIHNQLSEEWILERMRVVYE